MNKKGIVEWVVDLLLSCTHIAVEGIENEFSLPNIEQEYYCMICKRNVKIIRVGRPYILSTPIKRKNRD